MNANGKRIRAGDVVNDDLSSCSSEAGTVQPSGGPDKKQAFVVRLVKPTEAATQRLLEWSASLARSSPDTECWISVDATFPIQRETRQRLRRLQQAGWLRHSYDEDRMIRDFPELQKMFKVREVKVELAKDKKLGRKRSLAWGFHTEALNVWWEDVGRCYDHVWVFEDDVGYTGDISVFIEVRRRCFPSSAQLAASARPAARAPRLSSLAAVRVCV